MSRLRRPTSALLRRQDHGILANSSAQKVSVPDGWREIHDFEIEDIAVHGTVPRPNPSGRSLEGKRVVITQAQDFIGPALMERLRIAGAEVFGDNRDLIEPSAADKLITSIGHVDVLLVNLVLCNPSKAVTATTDRQWAMQFEALVHPLHRLVRAVLPQMIKRRSGKIVVIGSANAMRGAASHCAFSAASGAQLAYVKSVGVEVAAHNVQINAIAQGFVASPTFLADEQNAKANFEDQLADVPQRRLAEAWECAALAAFLASSGSDGFAGQVFPFADGWAG
jgi:2-keto-3-deoxy-L-fuconate dehydrogenase